MRRIVVFALIFGLQSYVTAQSDKEKITQLIHLYFDGWSTSDTAKIGKIMHHSCKLKYYRDDSLFVVDRHSYLSRFGPIKTRDAAVKTKIKSIDVTNNAAGAKITIETNKGLFTDYFNLIKIRDTWQIVDKITAYKAK